MTRYFRSAGLVALSLAFAVSAAACGSDKDSPSDGGDAPTGPIVIGAAIAKSGFVSAYDMPSYNSFKLRVDEINAAGGINGREIELIENDTKSVIDRGGQAAQELIDKGAEVMLVSCDFDFGSPAAAVAQKAGLVSISLCASSPKFGAQAIGDKAFSFQPSVGNQAAVLATFAMSKGWDTAFVLLDDTLAYTRGMNSAFVDFYEELGGSVADEDSFKNDDSSIATQISAIEAADPDVILMNSYPPGGASALRQIRAAGIDTPAIAGEAFDGTYWTDAVPGLSDFYISTDATIFGDDINPAVNEWAAAYEEKYDEAPSKGQSVMGYVVAQGLEKALEDTKGVTDGDTLAAALEAFKDVELITGPVSFSDSEHIPLNSPLVIMQYTDGQPKYVETVTPEVQVELTDGVG